MNKRPGQLTVLTEVGYCPFCERPRNLRREERHLGALVRMTLTCETCHRTLESSMGVSGEEKAAQAAPPAEKRAPAKAAPAKAAAKKAAPPAEKRAPAKAVPGKKAASTSAVAKPKARATAPTRPAAPPTAKRPAKGK